MINQLTLPSFSVLIISALLRFAYCIVSDVFKHLNLFLVVPVVAIIYFGIIYITKYISSEDIALVKQALRTK